jgi:hypothetical protein
VSPPNNEGGLDPTVSPPGYRTVLAVQCQMRGDCTGKVDDAGDAVLRQCGRGSTGLEHVYPEGVRLCRQQHVRVLHEAQHLQTGTTRPAAMITARSGSSILGQHGFWSHTLHCLLEVANTFDPVMNRLL